MTMALPRDCHVTTEAVVPRDAHFVLVSPRSGGRHICEGVRHKDMGSAEDILECTKR